MTRPRESHVIITHTHTHTHRDTCIYVWLQICGVTLISSNDVITVARHVKQPWSPSDAHDTLPTTVCWRTVGHYRRRRRRPLRIHRNTDMSIRRNKTNAMYRMDAHSARRLSIYAAAVRRIGGDIDWNDLVRTWFDEEKEPVYVCGDRVSK